MRGSVLRCPDTGSRLPQGPGAPGTQREWSDLRGGCFSHLLWLFSSSDLAQKARISKSTPQALGGGEKVTSYTRPLPLPPLTSFPLPCLGHGLLPHHGLRSVGPGSSASASPRPGPAEARSSLHKMSPSTQGRAGQEQEVSQLNSDHSIHPLPSGTFPYP